MLNITNTKISNLQKQPLLLISLALIVVVSLLVLFSDSDDIHWVSIHVSGTNQSGDAHLLKMPAGDVILLDTGFKQYAHNSLLPALQANGIEQINTILVSHAHKNHYGSVLVLLDKYPVEKVYFNLPPFQPCLNEKWFTGCNYEHVAKTRELIFAKAQLLSVKAGDIVYEDKDRNITLKALYYFDGSSEPLKGLGVNDASVVYKITYGKKSVLFTGDIGTRTGSFLASQSNTEDLRANVMTAPHHGMEDTAPNSFFDKVRPDIVIVSVAGALWDSPRGKQTREYFTEKNTPIYVTGKHGNIHIHLNKNRVKVINEDIQKQSS